MEIMNLVSSQHERKIKVRFLAQFWRHCNEQDTESYQADFRRGKSRNCTTKLADTQYASEPRNEFGEGIFCLKLSRTSAVKH